MTQSPTKIPLPFSKTEYDSRLAALGKRLADRGIEVLLVFIPANVLYLTGYVTIGFTNFQALIVPKTGKPFLFIREMERLVAEAATWGGDFDIFADDDDPIERLRAVLSAHGWLGKGLGAEKNGGFVSPKLMQEVDPRPRGV